MVLHGAARCNACSMLHATRTPTAAELRARRAELRVALYQLAAAAAVSPTKLMALLNERRPLTADAAERLAQALDRLGQAESAR